MILGPDLSVIQIAAKDAVMQHFVDLAEADGTPPTLRAMYVMKVEQAKRVLAGEESLDRQVEREAETRGWTAFQMATVILYMASPSIDIEDARMKANVAIEAAKDESAVNAVLAGLGVTLDVQI